VFEGWFEDSATTIRVGSANSTFAPTRSQTLHAKWVQNSLAGINPAHLSPLATINIAGAHTWSGSHAQSGTGAALSVPAGALPNGTQLKVSFVEDQSRSRDLIHQSYAYYSSVVVHWLTGSGDAATVPPTAANKPITLTLTNPSILPGAKVFMILGGVAAQVAEATEAGVVTIQITEDPEFVIAATPPGLPASLSATQVAQNTATVSWSAPTSTGGAPILGYTVSVSPGSQTCTTTELSCEITGLSSGISYSYSVFASNAIGSSAVRETTVTYVPAPVVRVPESNPSPVPPSSSATGQRAAPGFDSVNGGGTSRLPDGSVSLEPETPLTQENDKVSVESLDAGLEATQKEVEQGQPAAMWWLWSAAGLLIVVVVSLMAWSRSRRLS
jgi:hypothetical protein